MRRLALLLTGGAVWLFLAAIPVFADGGPHVVTINDGSGGMNADSCAGCHRIHTSQDTSGFLLAPPSNGINSFCLTCHGSTGAGAATNVADGVQYALAGTKYFARTDATQGSGAVIGALRGGGFVKARIDSSSGSRDIVPPDEETKNAFIPVLSAGVPVTSAHLVGATVGNSLTAKNIVWGNGPVGTGGGPTLTSKMVCTDCHNPHGNGNYRILAENPYIAQKVSGNPVDMTTGSLVSTGTTTGADGVKYVTSWASVVGMSVSDATFVQGRTRNYTVIEKAPNAAFNNKTAQPIPLSSFTSGDFLLFADQLTGYTASTGDYLHKFMSYNAQESSSGTDGVTITNFYDGPNGQPNQGGFTGTGGRWTNFVEKAPTSIADSDGTYASGFGYQMTLWCTQCHTRYLGWSSSRSTSSGDSTFMFRHSTGKYRVCLTCHVAHGSNASMAGTGGTTYSANVPYPNGSSPINGNSRLLKLDNRGICEACHDPTGTAEGPQGRATLAVPTAP